MSGQCMVKNNVSKAKNVLLKHRKCLSLIQLKMPNVVKTPLNIHYIYKYIQN